MSKVRFPKYSLAVAAIAACSATAQAATVSANAASAGDGYLGGGYHSWYDQYSSVPCLSQSRTEVRGGDGWLDFGGQMSSSEIKKRLKLNLDAEVEKGDFSLNRETSYLLKTTDKDLSLSYHFLFDYETERRFFVADPSDPLTPVGKQAASDRTWYQVCGDSYIQGEAVGGKLAVALKFGFSSEKSKTEFKDKVGGSFSILKKASLELELLSESLKRNTSLSIVAYQRGGNPANLAQVLGNSEDGSGVFAMNACTLDDLSQCHKLIDSVVSYASGTFAKDLAATPAVVRYSFAPYATAGVANLPADKELSDWALQVRDSVKLGFDNAVADLALAERIYQDYARRLSYEQKAALEDVIYDLEFNLELLVDWANACFESEEACRDKLYTFIDLSRSIDRTVLTVPAAIGLVNRRTVHLGWGAGTSCPAPDDHAITGVGVRLNNHNTITTLHLEVRSLNANGTLGERVVIKCGREPDHGLEHGKMLTLPDGYVMTGFAARLYKNNFTDISAYARKYEPLTVSLSHEERRFTLGGAGAEMSYSTSSQPEPTKALMTGIGLRAYESNLRGLHVELMDLQQAQQ